MASLRSRLTQLWRRGAPADPPPVEAPRTRQLQPQPQRGSREQVRSTYPGDFTGTPDLAYAPKPDGQPDPGEIVWTWVPYEEDHRQGKDRPVLLVGRDDRWLLALMLTSKDHDRDRFEEVAAAVRAAT